MSKGNHRIELGVDENADKYPNPKVTAEVPRGSITKKPKYLLDRSFVEELTEIIIPKINAVIIEAAAKRREFLRAVIGGTKNNEWRSLKKSPR